MKKAMTITYEVDEGLYVNMTNRCTNNCDFCIRHNGDGAYHSDSLWLEHEPTVEEVKKSIFDRDLSKYKELVFCGYGEPSIRLEDVREVALAVKAKCKDLPIRINTNGQSDLIFNKDTAQMYKDAFDTVSVSLNTPSPEAYQALCHCKFGERAHTALIEFSKNVKKYVPNVMLSVVRETLSEEELDECYRIAEECGVYLKVRTWIKGDED